MQMSMCFDFSHLYIINFLACKTWMYPHNKFAIHIIIFYFNFRFLENDTVELAFFSFSAIKPFTVSFSGEDNEEEFIFIT